LANFIDITIIYLTHNLSFIDNEDATLKRFYKETGRIRLQPENIELEPIYTSPENVEVQGRVIGVIKPEYFRPLENPLRDTVKVR